MNDSTFQIQLNMPREALAAERSAEMPGYVLGTESPLLPDPDNLDAHFCDPVTLIATVTIATMAWRILNHFLIRDEHGVLIDLRSSPPLVSRLENVPAGFILMVKKDGSTETIDANKTNDKNFTDLLHSALPLSPAAA